MIFIESRTFVKTSAIAVPACIIAFFVLDSFAARGHIAFSRASDLNVLLFFPIALLLPPIVVSSIIHIFKNRRTGWLLSILLFNVFAMYAYGFWVTSANRKTKEVEDGSVAPK